MSKREEWEEDHSQVSEFRSAVLSEFGKGLEKATPANVREFLDRFVWVSLSKNKAFWA